jgi:hypothetical protein
MPVAIGLRINVAEMFMGASASQSVIAGLGPVIHAVLGFGEAIAKSWMADQVRP